MVQNSWPNIYEADKKDHKLAFLGNWTEHKTKLFSSTMNGSRGKGGKESKKGKVEEWKDRNKGKWLNI